MSEGIQARPVGRLVRLLMGGLLTYHVPADHLLGAPLLLSLQVLAVVIGFVVFYALIQLAMTKFAPTIHPWLGAFIAVAPVILIFMVSGVPVRHGIVLFLGISLLLTGIRADAGCEVMTLPGMILGKRTHLVCIMLSPLDWVEEKIASLKHRHATSTTP